ncbi:MAG: DUF418 domain-containing protein, partial [Marinomonas sp.]
GLAVMGILWANIAGFGQPFNAVTFPDAFIGETGDSGGWLWISQFVLIDGKMRGLFTLLFGAGMYLFMERAWERGATRALQLWRLVILLIFGLVHFFFIWMGDILVMYSLIGFVAVACMRWTAKSQMIVGAIGYVFGALLMFAAMTFPYAIVDTPLGETPELAEQRTELVASIDQALADDKVYTDLKQSGDYWGLVEHRFGNDGLLPLANSGFFILETLPLMLMGMALYRFGFFSGAFNRSKMVLWGWVGLIGGAAGHLGLGLFAKSAGFSYFAVNSAYIGWSQLPRIAMIIGMAALLVVYSPAWSGWLAKRIRAAGRAAFSNYLGTSIIMLFVFHGWALGLFGELNRPQLYLVAAATCGLMLLWSKPWLDRFRYGPLEWLWRCMTYRKLFAFKR